MRHICLSLPVGASSRGRDGLFAVVAAHYVAGYIVEGGVVVEAAPILRWVVGLSSCAARRRLGRRVRVIWLGT